MKRILTTIITVTMAMATLVTLTSCEEEDDYIAQQLRQGDWQGYIGAYYSDRWGISGSTYATVMRFESRGSYYTSGRGYELNYNVNSPHRDYACSSFKWFIVDGEITLLYDDDVWTPIYIVDYSLGSSWFRGRIYTPSNQRIRFEFENIAYSDWDYYRNNRYGNYGDFDDPRYFRARALDRALDSVPLLNRTEHVRQLSGQPDAVSICSGEFARAMKAKVEK